MVVGLLKKDNQWQWLKLRQPDWLEMSNVRPCDFNFAFEGYPHLDDHWYHKINRQLPLRKAIKQLYELKSIRVTPSLPPTPETYEKLGVKTGLTYLETFVKTLAGATV